MEGLLRALQSPDNVARGQAEKQFQSALKSDVRTVMNELMQVILINQDAGLCQFGAVLFRGQVSKRDTGHRWWELLSAQERNDLRGVLLGRVRSAQTLPLKRHVGNIIAEVCVLSFNEGDDEWPDLLGELAKMALSSDDNGVLSQVAVGTLGEIVRVAPRKIEGVASQTRELAGLMCKLMAAPPANNNGTRISAMSTMSGLISLADEDELDDLEGTIKPLLAVLEHVAADDELLLKWCEHVIEVISMQPKLLAMSGTARDLVATMLRIAKNDGDKHFSEDARKQCLEVCVSLVVELPLAVKEDAELIRSMLEACIMFMLESTDDPDEIENEQVEGAAEEEDLLDAGARALYVVCECLGEQRTLPLLFPMVDELLLNSGDWRRQRAALLSLTRASYSGGKLMYDQLRHILQRMLPFVVNENSHLKVRLVGLDTLSALFLVFGDVASMFADDDMEGEPTADDEEEKPNLQTLFADDLLAALSSVLSEPTSSAPGAWALCSKAALAVAHFAFPFDEGKGAEVLASRIHEIFGKLHRLIELSGAIQQQQHQVSGGNPFASGGVDVSDVQGNVLNAVGSLAKALGESFGEFYDAFMPLAQKVYQVQEQAVATGAQVGAVAGVAKKQASKWTEKQAQLRGNALEAIGFMGTAVGKERFKQDASRLMQMIVEYMDHLWDRGDTDRNRQVAELAANICICMEVVEQPVLEKLVPRFIKWAETEAAYVPDEEELERYSESQAEGNEDEEQDEEDEENAKQYVFTDQGIVCINTFAMKEKESAIRIIQEMISSIGECLMPFAGLLAELMLKEIRNSDVVVTTPDLQLCSSFSLAKLVEATANFLRKQRSAGQLTNEQVSFAQQLFESALNAILEGIATAFEDCEEEDEEMEAAMTMGKEFDEDEEQNALLLTTMSAQVTAVLRAAFESGGMSDSDVDKICSPTYSREAFPPIFCLKDDGVAAAINSLVIIMGKACARKRGNPWWTNAHNHDVMDSLSEAVGLIVKTHGHAALPAFGTSVVPLAKELLDAEITKGGVTAPLKAVGLFFMDDAIEFGGPEAAVLVTLACPYMLQNATAKNYVLRQAAVFGLGVAAEHGGEHFTPFLEKTISVLMACVEAPGSRKPSNASATDNAISALFKCIFFRQQYAGIPKLLSYLPCTMDALEARTVHYRLYRLLVDQHPQFTPFASQIKQVLAAAAGDSAGFDKRKGTFDEDGAVLSNETRAWIVQNVPGAPSAPVPKVSK